MAQSPQTIRAYIGPARKGDASAIANGLEAAQVQIDLLKAKSATYLDFMESDSGAYVFDVADIPTGDGLTVSDGKLAAIDRASLKNGDFEYGLDGWVVTGGGWSADTAEKYSGAYSAKCVAGGSNRFLSQEFSAIAGQSYRVECFARTTTDGGSGTSRVGLSWFDASGAYVGESYQAISGDTWGRYSWVLTVPAGAARIQVYLQVTSGSTTGRLLVDQVTLTLLEPIAGSSAVARSASGIDLNLEATEFSVVGGKLTQYGVDFSKAIVGKYNGSEFEVASGEFRIKNLNVTKANAGTLSVGGPGQVSKFAVFNSTGSAIGWIGDDRAGSGYEGAWFKQLRVGGSTPADAKIAADTSGNVAIVNATFTMTKGVLYGATTYTVVTTINPSVEGSYTVGMKVEDQSGVGAGNNGAGVYVAPTTIYVKRALTATTAETNINAGNIGLGYGSTIGVYIQGSAAGRGVLLLDPSNIGGAGSSYISIGGQYVVKNRQSAPTVAPSTGSAFMPTFAGSVTIGSTYTATERGVLEALYGYFYYYQVLLNTEFRNQINGLIASHNSLLSKLNTSGHGLIA